MKACTYKLPERVKLPVIKFGLKSTDLLTSMSIINKGLLERFLHHFKFWTPLDPAKKQYVAVV